MSSTPTGERWGTCSTCGDAMPPGATRCGSCGKEYALPPSHATPTPRTLRRLRLHRSARAAIVAGIAVGLAGLMGLAVYQGPPIAADPLTNHWLLRADAGNFTTFSGAVTGGDYVTGNFTVLDPPGAVLLFEVFNASEFVRFTRDAPATPAQAPTNASAALIDFSAVVTDTYFFVWQNAYPRATQINVTVYVVTQYMSNVVVE
jgi:hypothetical protein